VRTLLFAVVLAAGAGFAQNKPTLLDHPLEVKSGLNAAQREKLQDDFRLLLARRSGVLVPTRTAWKTATAALNRQDCEVRDDCLRQLAVTGGTLYALYAQVEMNAAGSEAIATGRVVSQDGAAVRAAMRATAPVKGAFADAAKKALDALLDQLELDKLPPVLASAQPAATPPVAAATPATSEALPPPPPPPSAEPDVPRVAVERSPGSPALRAVAIVTTIAAVAGAGVALGFGIGAANDRATLPADGHLASEADAQKQAQVNQNATVALGVGIGAGALGVVSAILYVASAPSERPRVSAAPILGGGALSVSGSF
jgi:hypothetical protein